MLEKDIDTANRRLAKSSYDLLRDKNGLSLRPYQIEAIEKTEAAIVAGRQTVLLSMAPGTGRTRTMLGIIHRFLKSGRFKRVMLLVEHSVLDKQALDSFRKTKIEDHMRFGEVYNIKEFDEKDMETKVHVATVKSLVESIIYNDSEAMPSVTDYDLIIVDEANLGQSGDYISDYHLALEYFDAVKIALTATPTLETTEIFGSPIFEYTYYRAVTEGYLAGHDTPHDIGIKLPIENIAIPKEAVNGWELGDERPIDVESFNRLAVDESFSRAVLKEITRVIDPEGSGKTLIYAVDDDHANFIVKILKENYELKGITNRAIMKISCSDDNGEPQQATQAVKRFKHEKYPNIAVTADLLAAGSGVPEITTLVFMCRVKSRVLFEKMLVLQL